MASLDGLLSFTTDLANALPRDFKRTTAAEYKQLMGAHRSATGSNAFLVGREVYFDDQVVFPITRVKGNPQPLSQDLLPAFFAWEKPQKMLAEDLARITQGLHSILLRAKTWAEVRNMLPDRLLACSTFTPIDVPRTAVSLDDPDAAAAWSDTLVGMYARIKPLIDLYLGYKLL